MVHSHTISILEHLFLHLPPLVPDAVRESVKCSLERLRTNAYTREEIEKEVIVQGKFLWPYRRAFHEFSAWYETKLGKIFLGMHIPKVLQRRCNEFSAHGGTLEHLRANPPRSFFSDEEREILRHAFVNTGRDLMIHAGQAALSTHRIRYEAAVERHMRTLENIEGILQKLHRMADREEEAYPDLSDEIRAHIQSVEHGLSALGPPHPLSAIQHAEEHFEGRKHEKKMRV